MERGYFMPLFCPLVARAKDLVGEKGKDGGLCITHGAASWSFRGELCPFPSFLQPPPVSQIKTQNLLAASEDV